MHRAPIKELHNLRNAASSLAGHLQSNDIVWLVGPLGVGKTTFVQFLVQALKGQKHASSPSYVLLQTYAVDAPGISTVYHVDAFRLPRTNQAEPVFAELQEVASAPNSILVIEWADRVQSFIPPPTLTITFSYTQKNARALLFHGDRRLIPQEPS